MNTNPFAHVLLPPQTCALPRKFSKSASTASLSHPSSTSPIGLRDQAILRLLANGLSLRQIHKLNLQDVNEAQGIVTVPRRNGKTQIIILDPIDQSILSRWMTIRQLFANATEAVFISLHWTSGRAEPGQRLSERGIRLAIGKHSLAVNEK